MTRSCHVNKSCLIICIEKKKFFFFFDYYIDCIGADTTDKSLWPGFAVNVTGNCIDDDKLEVSWSLPKRKFPNYVFQSKRS